MSWEDDNWTRHVKELEIEHAERRWGRDAAILTDGTIPLTLDEMAEVEAYIAANPKCAIYVDALEADRQGWIAAVEELEDRVTGPDDSVPDGEAQPQSPPPGVNNPSVSGVAEVQR